MKKTVGTLVVGGLFVVALFAVLFAAAGLAMVTTAYLGQWALVVLLFLAFSWYAGWCLRDGRLPKRILAWLRLR